MSVLLLALGLRVWRLDQNGFDNEYYAAGVRSMLEGWHTFFYNSFDPAGFVSVDKPPLALWIQVASARLFGFSPLALLLPQVLEGVAAVAVLMHLVARRFGALAGILAGFFLALTPIAVASDRSGNTDPGLVLALLLAAWALLVAAERGRRAHLLLAMALIGVAFNVKMLAAFVVLQPGSSIDSPTLRDYLKGKVSRFEQPRDINIVGSIPRNPAGKVVRKEQST